MKRFAWSSAITIINSPRTISRGNNRAGTISALLDTGASSSADGRSITISDTPCSLFAGIRLFLGQEVMVVVANRLVQHLELRLMRPGAHLRDSGIVVITFLMRQFALDHREPPCPGRLLRGAQLGLVRKLDGEVEMALPLERAMEVLQDQRPIFGEHQLHRVHADDAVE